MWRVRARATTHDGRPGPQSGRISRCRIHGPSGYDQGIPNIFIAHASSLRCVCPCTTRQKSTFCKSIPSRNMAGWCCWCAKPPQFYILLIFNLQGLLEGGQSNGFVLRAHLQKVYAIAECTTHIMYCSTLFCSRKKMLILFNLLKTASIRADDHSTIGAILFAVLTPALFWNRARMVHCKSHFGPRLFIPAFT